MSLRDGLVRFGAVVLLCFSIEASQAEEPSITVSGTGEVLAKPDCLEVDIRAAAAAELSGDAAIKYQDALRRIRGAVTKLAIKELQIKERNLRIDSGSDDENEGVVFVGQPQSAAAKPEVRISRSLSVLVRGIDKMPEAEVIATISKLIDAAKDAGAGVGRQGGTVAYQVYSPNRATAAVVRFLVEHPEALREQAYRKAYEDALSRATRLAKLAHGRVGRATSIEEESAAVMQMYVNEDQPNDQAGLSTDELSDIPVRVALRVRFELLDVQAPAQQATREN